ncbi:MAG: hypothetical protein KGJ80_03040 [Chloroflexota bacterium]|nr:hypothetical protein [Chloroflexota bacterium]
MAWTRIVGVLGALVIATYLIQWLVPRRQTQESLRLSFLRWDIAPVVAFFGVLVLALSLAEAARQDVIAQWGAGIALGFIVSAGAWALTRYRRNAARPKGAWQYLRQYGALGPASALVLYLSVRVLGAALEVFIAGAIGMIVIAIAAAVFFGNRPITEENNGK